MILPSLYGLLLRFRLSSVAMVSDVQKAFLNIGLQTNDRDVTHFLWIRYTKVGTLTNNMQVYRFCRILFGVISPFLLGTTITYHLKQIGIPLAKQVQQDVYVDSIITGIQTVSEAKTLYTETKQMFAAASMTLSEWASNSEKLMDSISVTDRADHSNIKVLGISWNVKNDILSTYTRFVW